MKIAIADSNSRKFTDDIIKHWEQKGHEVKYEYGASGPLAQWADIYFVDTLDNNIAYLYKIYHGDPDNQRYEGWDNDKKPLMVCRALDWELWTQAIHRDQDIIGWVDKWICIAPHIEKKLRAEANFSPPSKLRLIRPGVNLEKFTLKTTKTDGFQLGMVLGDMWWIKNHMAGLDIFTTLHERDPRWRLHIRGQQPTDLADYWRPMTEHYLESRGIKDVVTIYEHVDDMNQWLEQIDVLLHPSLKETFCYAAAEAAAKGIPVVLNEFYGSRDIWAEEFLYQIHLEAVDMLQDSIGYTDNYYRKYIEDNYSLDKMLKELDEYIGC